MKKRMVLLVLAALLCVGCTQQGKEEQMKYQMVTAKEAKELMETQSGYIILDVRERDEYDQKHIPGAVLLPLGDVEGKAKVVLPNPEQLILVYCRSGRRSKIAAESLAQQGYTNVVEFGGILDWPYETE